MNKKVIGAGAIILAVTVFISSVRNSPIVSSVVSGNEDYSTTTIGKPVVTTYQVPECSNKLGTVNITAATALSAFTIKDATSTTDLSAVTIATYPSTAIGGSYVYDRYLTRGLQITIASGNGASTTITCK